MSPYWILGALAALVGIAVLALILAILTAATVYLHSQVTGLRRDLEQYERSRGRLYREAVEDQRASILRDMALVLSSARDQLDFLRRQDREMLRDLLREYMPQVGIQEKRENGRK